MCDDVRLIEKYKRGLEKLGFGWILVLGNGDEDVYVGGYVLDDQLQATIVVSLADMFEFYSIPKMEAAIGELAQYLDGGLENVDSATEKHAKGFVRPELSHWVVGGSGDE